MPLAYRGYRLNEFNNLRWELKVPAGGQVKVPYHYTIEYSNDLEVEITSPV